MKYATENVIKCIMHVFLAEPQPLFKFLIAVHLNSIQYILHISDISRILNGFQSDIPMR